MSILLHIDREAKTPVFRQISTRILDLIHKEALVPGDTLPASRNLAWQLGVNRSTVYKAYQELWALGYIESTPGSYSTVRKRALLASKNKAPEETLINWSERSNQAVSSTAGLYDYESSLIQAMRSEAQKSGKNPAVIDFTPLLPDPRLYPVDAYRKCLAQVLSQEGDGLLGYGDPLGYSPLREFIAERLQLHGVHTSKENIIITSGAQSALDMIFTAFTRPGDKVVVESPTYSRAIGLAQLHGITLLPVEMDSDGMNLKQFSEVLSTESPALIYTIPNFHNPTGITTSQVHREEFLKCAEQHCVPVIEDGFEEEMKYFGKAVLPIKSMDRHSIVLYVGTFSKVLFPGIRIGWIAADPNAIKQLSILHKFSHLSGAVSEQAALNLYCRRGFYENHIKKMHRTYRSRMHVALQKMEALLPFSHVTWSRPSGGYTLWLHMSTGGLSEEELLYKISSYGVLVAPGRFHYTNTHSGVDFRISIGAVNEQEITEGIRRLSEALDIS